jgi:hypothetical protein
MSYPPDIISDLVTYPEMEPVAEKWLRDHYPSRADKPGKAGTILKGGNWTFAKALLAIYLRPNMSIRAVGRRVGYAHQHVAALYRKLDASRD